MIGESVRNDEITIKLLQKVHSLMVGKQKMEVHKELQMNIKSSVKFELISPLYHWLRSGDRAVTSP